MRIRLIAVGVFGWLGAHVVLNVAAMTGIFPLTGYYAAATELRRNEYGVYCRCTWTCFSAFIVYN